MHNTRPIARCTRSWLLTGALALPTFLVLLWLVLPTGSTAGTAWAGSPPSGERILRAFGVGGVLTADGTLWQYRPDLDRWLTIDEAFRQEGREESAVLPLPVAAGEIAEMSTWGFFVTRSGELWLYEMAANKWRRLPPPGR